MRTVNEPRLESYFSNYYEGSVSHFSPQDMRILDLREHINGLLYKGDFAGVDGVIRGALYTNHSFCKAMIVWRSKWEQSQTTLLHDVIDKPKVDPPISLIKMILDIAPEVLLVPDVADFLPIESLIHQHMRKRGSSLELIQFLMEADKSKKSLTSRAFHNAVWRGDISVLQYLLSVENCKTILLESNALYYTVRNYFGGSNEGKMYLSKDFLKIMIEISAEEYKKEESNNNNGISPPRCCCFYDSVNVCFRNNKRFDKEMPQLLEMIKKDHLYCIEHKNEVEEIDINSEKRRRLEE